MVYGVWCVVWCDAPSLHASVWLPGNLNRGRKEVRGMEIKKKEKKKKKRDRREKKEKEKEKRKKKVEELRMRNRN
jgi:hypothetical protein